MNEFNADKAIAAFGYLVDQTKESMYMILKMLYVADKEHLENRGRTITGDNYFAMQKGPVPEMIYDACKVILGKKQYFDKLGIDPRDYFSNQGDYRFDLIVEPDLTFLSKSDIACLNEVIDLYKSNGSAFIRDLSHDSAWEAVYKNKSADAGSIPMPINLIASATREPASLLSYLTDPYPGSAS